MPIRGVLFDVDDTLFDYSTSERVGVEQQLAAEGLLDLFPSPAEAIAMWRCLMEEEYARFLAGELTFSGQQRARVKRLLAHIGRTPDGGLHDDEATAWFGRYEKFRNAAWTAFPDAEPALRALAPAFRLGVVSNSSLAHQQHKLRTLGLLHHFGEAVICSAEFGTAKPTAGIFLAGCEALGLPPEEVAYVGDKYETDALGARDAGLRAYWLDRDGNGTKVHERIAVIRSLAELPAALCG